MEAKKKKKIVSFFLTRGMSTITSLNTALETGLGSGCNILAMMLQQSVIDYIDENEGRTGLLTSELVSGGGGV